jgi:SWIM zinc finger
MSPRTPRRSYAVQSTTTANLTYLVRETPAGGYTCSCAAFQYHPYDCKHILSVARANAAPITQADIDELYS